MKKKKLKQHIAELESQLGTEKSRAEAWEHISHCFIGELKEQGAKTELIFPKPPLVNVSRLEDRKTIFKHGINAIPPTLSFDFTEHDKEIEIRNTRKILENYRKLLGWELEFEKE